MSDNNWTSGFGPAPARSGGNFLAPGVYDLSVISCVRRTSQNPATQGHTFVILEARVENVIVSYEAFSEGAMVFPASNKVGEAVSVLNNVTKMPQTAWPSVKGWLLAILRAKALEVGAPPPEEGQIDAPAWERALVAAVDGAGTKFVGTRIRCHASRGTTRAKTPFTNLRFEAVTPAARA